MKLVFPLTLSAILALSICGCVDDNYRDKNLEDKFIKKIVDSNYNNTTEISLVDIFGFEWQKICIQEPYMSIEDFERVSNHIKLSGFQYINDQFYTFWIFYNKGDYKWIKIKRSIVDKHPKNSVFCVDSLNSYLYFRDHSYSTRDKKKRKFYFST